jgi:carbohydrate-selective porin OprB
MIRRRHRLRGEVLLPLVAALSLLGSAVARADPGEASSASAPAAVDPTETGSAHSTDVEGVLEELSLDRLPILRWRPVARVRDAWHRTNDWLDDRTGIRLGIVFTSVLQHAPTAGDPNDSFVGTLDLLGRWSLLDHERWGRGALNLQLRTRDNWGAATGNDLSTSIGLPWSVYSAGSGDFTRVNQLYWEHHLLDDALSITLGRIDQKNFFDRNRVAGGSSTHFLGSPLVNNQTISAPSNGGGMNVEYRALDWLRLSIGFGDAAGDPSARPNVSVSNLFEDGLFTAAEITVGGDLGHLAAPLGVGAFRLMGWHTDDTGDPAVGTGAAPNRKGGGVAVGADQEIGRHLVAFMRAGHSPDAGLRSETEVSLGVGAPHPFGRISDFAGIGWTWADVLGADDDQYAVEAFYRVEVVEGVAVSPDVQLLFAPVHSTDDFAIVLGLRARVVF